MKNNNWMKELWSFLKVFIVTAAVVFLFVNYVAHPVTVVGRSMDPTLEDGEYGFTNLLSLNFSDPQPGDVVIVTMTTEDPNTGEETVSHWVKRIIAGPGQTVESRNDVIYVDGEPLDESAYIDEDYKTSITNQFGYFNKVVTENGLEDFGPVTLGEDEYWVMGDNRTYSKDSRDPSVGPVSRDQIYGTGLLVLFPFKKKAKRQMEDNLKKVDFIIEIRDARIPESSRNPMLDEIGRNKPRLIVLSKKDKADPQATKAWLDALNTEDSRAVALDLIKDNYRNIIVSESQKLCAPLIEKQKRRGIKPRALRAMVAGIPNVGKSTFINTLAKRKAAQTGDRPGVTKSLQWISLGSDLELLDTPGVLWPKFEDQDVGRRLALLGSIKDEVVDMDDLAMFACRQLSKEVPEKLESYYQIQIQEDPWQTLRQIAFKRGWLQKGDVDQDRLMRTFVKDLRENKLGPLTWERP
jgi:ribosome biogenesis GTPase A